ncbi:MAG TPA: exodeoxyribonuclease VII large subunit, partial [Pilimelia sp.]|nr:exodeoxyribonuclease VII large subunit [Pilimelia sp.]
LTHTVARPRALSPAATLQRGYAIEQRGDGHVVRAAAEVAPGDALRVRLADGELAATVAGAGRPGGGRGAARPDQERMDEEMGAR